MLILNADEVRQKLRILLFQKQIPVTRLAKDCGMDAKTILKASNGDMTGFTARRFSRFFDLREKGVLQPKIEENRTILGTERSKNRVVGQISRMYGELKQYRDSFGKSKETLEQMTHSELEVVFFNIESQLKYNLLKKYADVIEKYHIWLYDKWDYWQWKEKLELTLRDTGK